MNNFNFSNKRVLVTGASTGIGRIIAESFLKAGALVGIHFNQGASRIESLKKELDKAGLLKNSFFYQADFSHPAESARLVDDFASQLGGIDVLVNNAGAVGSYSHFTDLAESDWDHAFTINTKAPFFLIQKAFPLMQAQKWGRIINISSQTVKYGGSAKGLHYAAAKAALDSLTLGLARAGASENVLINSIRPGVVDTGIRNKISGYTAEDWQKRIDMIPMKKTGTPQNIADLALFLASPGADYITGQVIAVAGGD